MGQDGANRYAYVYNRPTTMVDPSGFCAINIYIPYWGYTCGGGGSGGGTSNPVQLVNPGGKTGYLMTMTMAPDVGVPPGQFSNPVVASTSGQIIELIDVDDQAGTSSDAASATAAGGDGNGDGTTPASQQAAATAAGEAAKYSSTMTKALMDLENGNYAKEVQVEKGKFSIGGTKGAFLLEGNAEREGAFPGSGKATLSITRPGLQARKIELYLFYFKDKSWIERTIDIHDRAQVE